MSQEIRVIIADKRARARLARSLELRRANRK
jgi:hypothetical protein